MLLNIWFWYIINIRDRFQLSSLADRFLSRILWAKELIIMNLVISGKKIEITIPMKGSIIRAEEVSSDMYVSIDLVEEVIERQLRKYKNKLIDKAQNAAHLNQEFIDEDMEDEEEINIIRSKKFAMKPMDPEEACVQMELLGHNFFVFRNSETDEVNVVYKRKGNTYGLIEPEY